MPELPEVETIVKDLRKRVLRRALLNVWTDAPKIIKRPSNFDEFKKQIKDKKILRVWRRAKNIIIDLSGGYSLLIHQKMTGHLLYGKWKIADGKWKPINKGPLNDPMNRFLRLIFWLDNKYMLALCDLRKFAKVELWKKKDLLQELKKIGPEPLEKSFTFKRFKSIFSNKKGKIKQVLMKPEVIAGIGNIYSDEILWRAKVYPLIEASKLNENELKLIFENIKKVLLKAIKLGGESFSDFRKLDGTKGSFDAERAVYQREGEKCKRCYTIIKRIKIGGRSSCFCPKCQRL